MAKRTTTNEQKRVSIDSLSSWLEEMIGKADKQCADYSAKGDFENAQFSDGVAVGLQMVWDKLHGYFDERNFTYYD